LSWFWVALQRTQINPAIANKGRQKVGNEENLRERRKKN
jgi:hypothetical protein